VERVRIERQHQKVRKSESSGKCCQRVLKFIEYCNKEDCGREVQTHKSRWKRCIQHLSEVAVEGRGCVIEVLILQVVGGTSNEWTRALAARISVKPADNSSFDFARGNCIVVLADTVASVEISGPGNAVTTEVAVVASRQQVVGRTDGCDC